MNNTEKYDYYLGNFDNPPVRFTIQTGTRTIIQELPWDVGADELCDAFYTALIGMTFHPDGVVQAMKEFVEEHTPIEPDYDNITTEE